MLDFDFCEVLNEVDFDYIEKRVNGLNQIQMELLYEVYENILKNKDSFEYEKEQAKVYIEKIERKMMNIKSSELVVI